MRGHLQFRGQDTLGFGRPRKGVALGSESKGLRARASPFHSSLCLHHSPSPREQQAGGWRGQTDDILPLAPSKSQSASCGQLWGAQESLCWPDQTAAQIAAIPASHAGLPPYPTHHRAGVPQQFSLLASEQRPQNRRE